MRKSKRIYACDFETTTESPSRVWLWAMYRIDGGEYLNGLDIDSFLENVLGRVNSLFYFHNLKFDGKFIISYLESKMGYRSYKPSDNIKGLEKAYQPLINVQGEWYSIKVSDGIKVAEIRDSLKKIPGSVRSIAKSFGLDVIKGEIDYHKRRDIGYEPTEEEYEYIKNDVTIIGKVLNRMYGDGRKKMTAGSDALYEYRKSNKQFDSDFPRLALSEDEFMREGYNGGYVYLKKEYVNKVVEGGVVYDVNSMYPWAMRYNVMPYGSPVYFEGEPDRSLLFIVRMRLEFYIKDGYPPIIALSNFFRSKDYLEECCEHAEITVTSIDLELIEKHYNVFNVEYIDGYYFKSSMGLFDDYIDKWNSEKGRGKEIGDMYLSTTAKLNMNSLYGKFGKKLIIGNKLTYVKDGVVKYSEVYPEETEGLYLPVAAFTTAYARKKLLQAFVDNYDRVIYCDTDSLHLKGLEPANLETDDKKLGYWKKEVEFTRAKYIQQKRYIYEVDGKLKVKCAGLTDDCHVEVTFDNFKLGSTYYKKKVMISVEGGAILKEREFTLK